MTTIHRFYIDTSLGEVGEAFGVDDPDLVHQVANVLRMRKGEHINLFSCPPSVGGMSLRVPEAIQSSSSRELTYEILELTKKSLLLKGISEVTRPLPRREVHLYFSLLKGDHTELVLEKCTEIGVTHFHPVIFERSQIKDLSGNKRVRAERIIKEALEQSENIIMPVLHDVVASQDLKDIETPAFLAYERTSTSKNLHEVSLDKSKLVSLFVGPEGGITDTEKEYLVSLGTDVVTLGHSILRAETACIVGSYVLLA